MHRINAGLVRQSPTRNIATFVTSHRAREQVGRSPAGKQRRNVNKSTTTAIHHAGHVSAIRTKTTASLPSTIGEALDVSLRSTYESGTSWNELEKVRYISAICVSCVIAVMPTQRHLGRFVRFWLRKWHCSSVRARLEYDYRN